MEVPGLYKSIEPLSGFRILVLHASTNRNDEIVCSLISSNLRNHAPYEALSYVWGSSEERRVVTLEGQQVRVTVNLERALRNLRLSDKDRNLWVDALCINQDDIEERNIHVQYMNKVYANCTIDHLWLGEDDEILTQGAKMMKEYESLLALDDEIRRSTNTPDLDVLKRLFASPTVWKRAWIMQEIAHAPNVQLVAGTATMPWSTIEDFLGIDAYIERYGVPDAYHAPFSHDFGVRSRFNNTLAYPQILAMQRRVTQNEALYEGYETKLIDVLARFRYTAATDPRDKIFAFLGLTANPSEVQVNYKDSVRELYIRVAGKLLELEGNLDLICQGPWQLYENEARNPDLPSWVPDFSQPGESRILFAHRGIFNAFGTDEVSPDFPIIAKGTLRLRGFKLDTVSIVRSYPSSYVRPSALFLSWMPEAHYSPAIRQADPGLKRRLGIGQKEKLPSSIKRLSTYEAYWRTWMTDCLQRPTRRIDTAKDLEGLQKLFSDFLESPPNASGWKNSFEVEQMIDRVGRKWVFAISSQGHYCMVPPGIEKGDQIAVLRGAKTPIILRSAGNKKNEYQWIGACYVHGFMDGQILLEHGPSGREESTFDIV